MNKKSEQTQINFLCNNTIMYIKSSFHGMTTFFFALPSDSKASVSNKIDGCGEGTVWDGVSALSESHLLN